MSLPVQVLSRGMGRRVHHTLKSQLAEDTVRHSHGLLPRAAEDEGGLSHSRMIRSHSRWPWGGASVAAVEQGMRERAGLPVHGEIRAAAESHEAPKEYVWPGLQRWASRDGKKGKTRQVRALGSGGERRCAGGRGGGQQDDA